MELDKDTKQIKHAIETYTQLKSVINIEISKRCKHLVLDKKFRDKYGLELTDFSSSIIQLFYEIGKEDALKEIKEKLNNIEL
jgi:hypothetical protein